MNRLAAILFLVLALSTEAADLYFDFGSSNALSGFHSTVTGEGKPGLWRVLEDEVPSTMPKVSLV